MSGKNFTVYKSSAGSGKTFTLVKEYLALALNDEANPPKRYRHILAITFTNKAAAEMKERIVKALEELSKDDYSSLSAGTKTLLIQLKEHQRLNVHKQLDDVIIRKRAQNVLSAVLHNYSDFAISTIDSFVHKIVRTFAFDLKIPMSFELEMDADKLLTEAIDMLLAQIGSNESITKALVEFAESKTDDEKSWHIENDLKQFAANLLNEEGIVHIEKLRELSVEDFFKIKNQLQAEIKKFDEYISKYGKEAIDVIAVAGIEPETFAGGAKMGIHKYFTYLSEAKSDKLIPSATLQKNIDSDKWYSAKASSSDKAQIDIVKNRLLQLFNGSWEYIQENVQEITLFRLINTTIYSLAVLNEIEKLLNEHKAQNNILHISEFNKMISKIVLNEPIPFIYERLGEKYNNYLIDEFQDTSVLQFHNLLPLIDNSLAAGHFTMLVGDGKQAIYRWRGGEVEQFALLPEVFAHNNNPLILEREQALQRSYKLEVLDKNYRSKREIIEFNNSIFKVLSDQLNERYQSIYSTLEQGFLAENTGGYVQTEFLEGEGEEAYELNLQRTYEIVVELVSQNYQWKDIAVLVRKNTDGSEIANYLSQKGIAVLSSDSLLLSKSAEVNFICSLLNYLNNRDDQIVQAELLEYFVASKQLAVTDINELFIESKENGFTSIVKKVCPDFSAYYLSKIPLYELCEELIRLFSLNNTPNAYIQFFLDEVLNYSIKKNNNLNDFINHWNDKKDKISLMVPEGMNAVTIMTIHKAKGLEFPAVILPFSSGRVKNGKNHLWIDVENEKIPELTAALIPTNERLRETAYAELYEDEKSKSLLDSLNVLYVALTRPQERLYILAGKPSKTPSNLSNTSDMFAYYYQTTGEWKESKQLYSFGKQINHKPKGQAKETLNIELSTFNSTQWRNSIKMRAAAPSIWNLEVANTKKDYGVLVHTAMAKIKSGDDVEPAVNSMFVNGLISNDEKEALSITLTKITTHPQLQNYFAKGLIIKNEAEIITANGEFFRPDRVVFIDKAAVIMDYKTGEEKPAHKKQIFQYADLLEQMGYSVTEKLLVYIEEEKVVRV
jgi:ATP-dependent exoDNAse (exonuclease V) beta subunit